MIVANAHLIFNISVSCFFLVMMKALGRLSELMLPVLSSENAVQPR